MTLWLDYVSSSATSTARGSHYVKLLLLALALGFAGSIGYSRLFLGVHSLNQVLYGLSCGLWLAISAHFIAREPLIAIATELIEGRQTWKLSQLFLISTGLASLVMIIHIINYQVALKFQNPQEWSEMQVEKCGKDSLTDAY